MTVETIGAVPQPAAAGHSPRAKARLIRKVGVLGAGSMGSRIAAHLANVGISVVLLDVPKGSPKEGKTARNVLAASALDMLQRVKPPAFVQSSIASTISIGNFEDDLELLRDCDWIIEAVA